MYDWQIMVGDNGNLFTMRTCSQLKTYDSTSSIFCDEPQEGQYLTVLNPHGPVVICELYEYGKYSCAANTTCILLVPTMYSTVFRLFMNY